MQFRFLFLFAILVSWAHATSVVPPSFSELVTEADAIYRGRVSEVQARRVARADGGSVIKTFVTIVIDRALKGSEQRTVTLEFLGGTIGDESMEVSGMPTFTVGDRSVVFVQKNGQQFCPLVRMGHGTYAIARDDATGEEYMARQNGAPLNDVSEVEIPLSDRPQMAASRTTAGALSPAAFEARIASEVSRSAASPQTK